MTEVTTVFEAYGTAFTEGGLAMITEGNILSVWVINTAHRSSPGFRMHQET
jgi:ABC-type tungstate transport system substrate-binding protein